MLHQRAVATHPPAHEQAPFATQKDCPEQQAPAIPKAQGPWTYTNVSPQFDGGEELLGVGVAPTDAGLWRMWPK